MRKGKVLGKDFGGNKLPPKDRFCTFLSKVHGVRWVSFSLSSYRFVLFFFSRCFISFLSVRILTSSGVRRFDDLGRFLLHAPIKVF